MLKNDMIDGIEYHFRKQGKRLTNLRKVPMSKLEEIIKKHNVNIVDEVNEYKEKKEQAKKEEEAERVRDVEERRRIREEREELLAIKNDNCIKKYIELTNDQKNIFLEKIFDEANTDRNREISVSKSLTDALYNKLKAEGRKVIRDDDTTLKINGTYLNVAPRYNLLDKEKFIAELKQNLLTNIHNYEKLLDEVWGDWFEIVLPVKNPKTKKVKKVKKVVEEPEEREQFCCCCFVTHDEWYVLGASDTPMCPCNPDFEGDRDEYYKENDMEDPHTVSRFDFCCGCNKMKDVKYYKEKYELLCDECIV